MGVELRKGRLYWYERRRVDGRVRVDYFGPVSAARRADDTARELDWTGFVGA